MAYLEVMTDQFEKHIIQEGELKEQATAEYYWVLHNTHRWRLDKLL